LISSFNEQNKIRTTTGITASWNLFDGFNSSSKLAESVENISIAQTNLYIVKKDLERKCVAMSIALNISKEELSITSQYLDFRELEMQVRREQHSLGEISSIELADTYSNFQAQMLNLLKISEKVAFLEAKLLLSGLPTDCQ